LAGQPFQISWSPNMVLGPSGSRVSEPWCATPRPIVPNTEFGLERLAPLLDLKLRVTFGSLSDPQGSFGSPWFIAASGSRANLQVVGQVAAVGVDMCMITTCNTCVQD
jgi:hypothetical protein